MQAQEILTATRNLEESGMTQPQAAAIASTIVDAIEPLATKEDLRNTEKLFRSDLQSSVKELRAELRSSIKELRTDMESLKENMATKADIQSIKVWLLTGLLALAGSALLGMIGAFFFLFRFIG